MLWKITSACLNKRRGNFVAIELFWNCQLPFWRGGVFWKFGQISRFIKETLSFYVVENYLGVKTPPRYFFAFELFWNGQLPFWRGGVIWKFGKISRCIKETLSFYGVENYLGVKQKTPRYFLQLSCFEIANYHFGAEGWFGNSATYLGWLKKRSVSMLWGITSSFFLLTPRYFFCNWAVLKWSITF